MLTIEECLRLFEVASLDELTLPRLKSTFKSKCFHAHPDRGGSSDEFDHLLQAYSTLYRVLRRANPRGIDTQTDEETALDPHAVMEARDRAFMEELHLTVGELMESMEHLEAEEQNRAFNAEFDRIHSKAAANTKEMDTKETATKDTAFTIASQQSGYGAWMSTEDVGGPEEIKQEEFSDPSVFHETFETRARTQYPPTSTAIICAGDAVSTNGKKMGQELVSVATDGQRIHYTSGMGGCYEGGDLMTVYEESPTFIQEISVESMETQRTREKQPVMDQFEAILKERELVYRTELDRDLLAIAEYESRQQDMERRRIEEVRQYFRGTASSAWALKE